MFVKKSSFFIECLPNQRWIIEVRYGGPGKIKAVLRTWDASNEVSIGIFLFLPVPSFIVIRIMSARGCSRCDGGCAWVAFFSLSLVGRGRNGGRCW